MELFKATDAMKANNSKGKAWNKKKESKRSYTNPYEMTSKSFNDDFNIDEVKTLYGFLNKQKDKINKYNVDTDKFPTHEYCDWLESGANAALSWSKEILKSNNMLQLNGDFSYDKNKEEEGRFTEYQVSKSTNQELMQATYVVLEPQEGDYTTDLHEDTYTEDEVRKACHNFNIFCRKANLLHLTETTSFAFVESYTAPVDFVLNDEFVKKGTWVATIQVFDEDVWDAIKKGHLTGLSIQCLAKTEYLNEESE